MKRLIPLLLLLALSLGARAQMGTATRDMIKAFATEFTAECPFDAGGFVLEGAQLTRKELIIKFRIKAGQANLYRNLPAEGLKESLRPMVPAMLEPNMMQGLIDNKLAFTLEMAVPGVKRSTRISLTPAELADLLANGTSLKADAVAQAIAAQARNIQSQCPLQVDQFTTIDSVDFDGTTITYHYSIDDTAVDIDELEANIETLKFNNLMHMQSSMNTALDNYRLAGIHFRHIYTARRTARQITFTITPEEY